MVALRKESVDRNYRRFGAIQHTEVALRKESVDRNDNGNAVAVSDLESLSARRAWIEIFVNLRVLDGSKVALRKESVDRNGALPLSGPRAHCRSPQGERG